MNKRQTYQRLNPKQLPPLLRQINIANSNLPTSAIPSDLDAQRAPEYLVPEAYTQDLNAGVLDCFLGVFDEFQDPGVVFEGVVLCSSIPLASSHIITGVKLKKKKKKLS